MKNLFGACLIILTLAVSSFAEVSKVLLNVAVKESDLIIVGTLREISEKNGSIGISGNGMILIEQFIAGNVKTDKGLTPSAGDGFELDYVENNACVMGSHRAIENEKGVFLLYFDESGELKAEDFRPLSDLAEIKRLLKKGVRRQKASKMIKTLKDAEQEINVPSLKNPSEENSPITFGIDEIDPTPDFGAVRAFFVLSFSGALYYFLYRSRFKIR